MLHESRQQVGYLNAQTQTGHRPGANGLSVACCVLGKMNALSCVCACAEAVVGDIGVSTIGAAQAHERAPIPICPSSGCHTAAASCRSLLSIIICRSS